MSSTLTTSSPGTEASSPSLGEKPPSPWIYRAWIDLLIGCGGWSAPLLLLTYFGATAHLHAWTAGFYFLALLFNYPHFMATVYRAYHTQTEFKKYQIFTVHVALVLGLAGVVTHLWYPLLPWVFTLYICWSPWHYTGQNFGLLMMFARRVGISPNSGERRALWLSFVASYVLLLLSFQTGASSDALVLSLGLPAKFTLPARAALAIFFVAASAWALGSLARRSSLRAIVAPLTLAVTQFLWFLVPALVEIFSGHEIPQTRYSSGILAVLHSAQYLWITSYYQGREARAAGNTNWKYWRYLLTLTAGGIALFIPGPWIASRVFHADFAASFLTFTALVNIHHFILDGALWKLRDSRIAAFLLDTREKTGDSETRKEDVFLGTARWLAGPAWAARALRLTTVVSLLAWAAVDQLHFYWSSKTDSLPALQRAAKLNPDDSAVQMSLARAEAQKGDHDATLAALRHAAAVNPGNFSLQEVYARGLIENGRDADAYAQYRAMLERWPRDVGALVNYGLLAHRLGHEEEAVDSWQRAADADPHQSSAQLYLAQALDQRGERQAAARHFRTYLQIVAAHGEEHPGEAASVLAALVKVADADASINHANDAMRGYNTAVRLAEKIGDKALESLALVHLADLQEKQGDAGAAAESYQRALALDGALSDPRSAASDWVNYGQFLRRRQQPERLVLACFLHAENLVRGSPGEELSAIVQAREESERRLGHEAAAVGKDEDAAAKEAATLPITSLKFSN
jgi:tetratricopeptide (TPR) repeat protein